MPSARDDNRSPDPDLYCAIPSLIASLGNGFCVAHNLANGRSTMTTVEAAQVLQAHRTFRSLDPPYVAELASASPDSRSVAPFEDAITGVRGLVENGWLVSHHEFLQRLMTADGQPASDPALISSVGVITKNRPQCLARFLDGLLVNRQSFGKTYQAVVLDDSIGESGSDTRSQAAKLAAQYGAPVRYCGHLDKRAFIERLAKRCTVSPSLLEFALIGPAGIGPTFGANLNCFLLQTAGELAACFDDDVVCRAAAVPGARAELVFSAAADPTEFHFCESRSAATALLCWDDRDVVGLHEQALGRSLQDLMSEYWPDHVRCDSVTPRLLRTSATVEGRVAVTSLGIAGDSGMSSPQSLLRKGGVSRQRLLASSDTYRSACSTREVIRGAPAICITGGGALMSAAVGIDNRSQVVPFMPALRNMEGVFALSMPLASEHAYFAHLPSVVMHEPPEARVYHPDSVWRDVGAIRTSDVLGACVISAPLPAGAGSEEDRLGAIGRHLENLGLMQLKMFEEFFRVHVVKAQYARLRTLGSLLGLDGSGAQQWRSDVKAQMREIRRSLEDDGLTVPIDVVETGHPAEHALRIAQEIVLGFGRLLQVWPQLVHAAMELKAEGAGLARPCHADPESRPVCV